MARGLHDMSGCEACERAAANAQSGMYQVGCMACEARAIAQSPAAHKRDSDPSELQAAMRLIWKADADYRKGRALVWAAIKAQSERPA